MSAQLRRLRRSRMRTGLRILLFLSAWVNAYLVLMLGDVPRNERASSAVAINSEERLLLSKFDAKLEALEARNDRASTAVAVNSDLSPSQSDSKLEFVHITKTAGTSIERTAAKHGIKWGICHFRRMKGLGPGCTKPDIMASLARTTDNWYNESRIPLDMSKRRRRVPLEPWHTPHHWFRKDIYGGKATFVVIRNPYHRVLSEYHCKYSGYKGKDRDDPVVMNRVVRRKIARSTTELLWHYMPQHWYVFDAEGRQRVDHVVRYEELDRDFPRLMAAYNLTLALPARDGAGDMGARLTVANLTRKTLLLITARYEEDFLRFEYAVKTRQHSQ